MLKLLNLFKTERAEATVIDNSIETKELIEQIHNEFNTAGDKQLADALAILEEEGKKDVAKGLALESIGFKLAKQVEEAKVSVKISSEKKEEARTIKDLQQKYPNYKFISKENIEIINKKYNLIIGNIRLYTGFVPSKNLEDIENFFKIYQSNNTIKKEAYYLTDILFISSSVDKDGIQDIKKYLSEESNKYFTNREKFEDYLSRTIGHKGSQNYTSLEIKYEIVSSLSICAPSKNMDTKSKVLNIKEIPDPVVLYPINDKGYLIVTAWGDEASDPLVANENLN